MNNEELYKELTREKACEGFFDVWLDQFQIENPTSDFFEDPENADENLVCNIFSKLEFMVHTLEIFGLPKDYLNGGGHHLNWEQQKQAAAAGRGKKAKKAGKVNKALEKMQKQLEAKKQDMNKKPTYFDMEPIKKALKSFIALAAESRSALRTQLILNKQ